MSTSSYTNSNIYILDTGDNYIIAYDINNNSSYKDGIKLYSMMDICINEILVTSLINNVDLMEFIYNNIGRIISYGFSDNNADCRIDIPAKLKDDIIKVIEMYKIKSFWENMQFPARAKKVDIDICYDRYLTFESLIPKEHSVFSQSPLNLPSDNIISERVYDNGLYILYNEIYNIVLVVELSNINKILDIFREFKLIITYDKTTLKSNIKDEMNRFFHKVSFESEEDVKSKVKAFENLYNFGNNDIKFDFKEKIKIKQFLDWHYTLSDDIDKKMKANDLYKEVINHMCIDNNSSAAFKKRLAGYLLELNLHKKRFSDAYYYYGILKKEKPIIDLKDIEEKRSDDKKLWIKYDQSNMTNNFDLKIKEKAELMRKMRFGDKPISDTIDTISDTIDDIVIPQRQGGLLNLIKKADFE